MQGIPWNPQQKSGSGTIGLEVGKGSREKKEKNWTYGTGGLGCQA